jgi:hypothetical protein
VQFYMQSVGTPHMYRSTATWPELSCDTNHVHWLMEGKARGYKKCIAGIMRAFF